jgi:hypothetical protein
LSGEAATPTSGLAFLPFSPERGSRTFK